MKRKYSFVQKSILIFFLFSLPLLFPSRQYAYPSCAALDTDHSQCVPAGQPPPTPVRDCSNLHNPPGPDPRCQWFVLYSNSSGAACKGTCYGTEDSCAILYTYGQNGQCSVVSDDKLLCKGYIEEPNQAGCNGSFPICYGLAVNKPSPPVACTSQPPGTVPNPCPNNICNTALGPIDVTNGSTFVRVIFQALLGISGGIALLMIIISGYNMAISQGNPEKIKGAQETLTAAIIGLLFIILSVAILQIIGVDILKLPGFNP